LANQNLNARLISRNDTTINWSTQNPILLKGELGIEIDTLGLKVGDGVTNWNDLSYLQMGGASSSLLIVKGTLFASDWENNMQVVKVEGVTANNLVIVTFSDYANEKQISAIGQNGVSCVSQTLNKVIFTCKTVPDVDIPLQFIIGLSLDSQGMTTKYVNTEDLIINLPLETYDEGRVIKIKYMGEDTDSGYININELGSKKVLGMLKNNTEHTLIFNGENFVSDMFLVTIPTLGWTESLPYQKDIEVLGMSSSTRIIAKILQSDDMEDAIKQKEEWNKISKIETEENMIKVFCYEQKPNIDLQLEIVRI
jgi:hypothetical protein